MAERPRIVVLDGYALNPGDLDWDGFEALGQVTVYDRTPRDQVPDRAAGAPIVLTNKAILDRATIERLPALRYIGVLATGYNVVDLAAARERGIPVTNVPEYGTPSVVQMVFAHLLEHAMHLSMHDASVKAGDWSRNPDFTYHLAPLVELAGRTMGIVGFGRIGRAVADVALAFGMRVLVNDAVKPEGLPEGAFFAGLDDLFRESDVVTLHCPLTPETDGMVNAGRLALMKPTAFLINTGRGPLVVPEDLAPALAEGRIAGAGLDVMITEPPNPADPLLQAPNITITPHIAWATHEARKRLLDIAVDNVRAFLDGDPVNVVN